MLRLRVVGRAAHVLARKRDLLVPLAPAQQMCIVAVLASSPTVEPNSNVQAFVTVVNDESARLLSTLQLLQLWIYLQLAKIEAGRNFGSEVQQYTHVLSKELHVKRKTWWNSLADYYRGQVGEWGRGTATDDVITANKEKIELRGKNDRAGFNL
uniref:Proteasome activator PA28 C-terminal domain-containing protein n=1 Tax=Peronospora matthiolae TaxID=2874970 RepID=A0AAV1U4L1_9STRA